jgi:hypothetical protein
MPRFGFAYQLFPKTTLRGGYGVFFDTVGVNKTAGLQTGFSQSTKSAAWRRFFPGDDRGSTSWSRFDRPDMGRRRLRNSTQGLQGFDHGPDLWRRLADCFLPVFVMPPRCTRLPVVCFARH